MEKKGWRKLFYLQLKRPLAGTEAFSGRPHPRWKHSDGRRRRRGSWGRQWEGFRFLRRYDDFSRCANFLGLRRGGRFSWNRFRTMQEGYLSTYMAWAQAWLEIKARYRNEEKYQLRFDLPFGTAGDAGLARKTPRSKEHNALTGFSHFSKEP